MPRILLLPAVLLLASCAMTPPSDEPRTVAERTEYRETSRHSDVLEFIEALRTKTEAVEVRSMGKSGLGQDMPYLVLGTEGKPVVLIIANIHAGEVEGKAVALMLARDLTIGAHRGLLDHIRLLIIPNYNPDGNDAISKRNRKFNPKTLQGQIGPEGGVGTRWTGKGINLNRDYMKLEAVESRNLMKLFGRWKPHLTMDLHTTNGSLHRFALTYDTAHNRKSGPSKPIEYVFDRLLPQVTGAVKKNAGIDMFFYGNWRDSKKPEAGWETYSPLPRYGSHYRGLTGRMDVLSEAYAKIPFRKRAEATYAFVLEVLRHVAENGDEIRSIVEAAEKDTIARGENPGAEDRVGINYGVERRRGGKLFFSYPADSLVENVTILTWDAESLKANRLVGATPRDLKTTYFADFIPKKSVGRPYAYVLPADLTDVLQKLRDHNIRMERLTETTETSVETYKVKRIEKTYSPDIGKPSYRRFETVLSVEASTEQRKLMKGSVIVRTAQPLAHVAIYLLEPESDDGLARWNFFDKRVSEGGAFPVLRVPGKADLPTEEYP